MNRHDWTGRALRCLDSIRPYQSILYIGLIGWSIYSIVWTPTSPIVRFMPDWVRIAYLILQGVAPIVAFVGQWVYCRSPNPRTVESGWWLQWAADAAIVWSVVVAITAFAQATDEPSALFVVWFLAAMAINATLLAVRDIIHATRIRRDRTTSGAVDEP